MTMFVTKGGIGLQYLPGPLDKYIDRKIDTDGEEWTDAMTGKALSAAEKEQYEHYQQRHPDRCRVGEKADKLANIVDSYMPQLAHETRAYMIRFPHEVKKLLKKARQIRNKIKARQKRGDTPAASQATPARRAQQQAAEAKPEQEGTTKDKCEEPRGPAAAGEEKTTVPAETEGNEFDDVDWGALTLRLGHQRGRTSQKFELRPGSAKANKRPTGARAETGRALERKGPERQAGAREGTQCTCGPVTSGRRCRVYKNT